MNYLTNLKIITRKIKLNWKNWFFIVKSNYKIFFCSKDYFKLIENSKNFITAAKKLSNAKLSAFIFLRQEKHQTEGGAALDILLGADAVLYSPFSVDDVVATTKIADAIRAQDEDARNKAAMSLLLDSVMSEVDQIGEANSKAEPNEKSTPPKLGKLKQLGLQLKQAAQTTSVDYFGVISKAFIEAVPPIDKGIKQGYGGVSARVQRKIEEKARLKTETVT